jgi:hypothetical protein
VPLRRDPRLCWNWPGVVAYFQPVGCPGGSLLARYNMAHGGDNRYRAESAVLPAWSPLAGWSISSSTQWLDTGIFVSDGNWSCVYRFQITGTGVGRGFFGHRQSGCAFGIGNSGAGGLYFWNGGLRTGGSSASAIIGISARQAYRDGLPYLAEIATGAAWPATTPIAIGRYYGENSEIATVHAAAAFYSVQLSPVKMALASHQMAYCDRNPAWSVWSRRREWYYSAEVAAAVARRRTADAGRVGSRGAAE